MPGLVRGIARTAVIAGTATATSNAVNRRQASKNMAAYDQAAQQVAPPPAAAPVYAAPAPAAPEEDMYAQLERLGALKAQGILTEEEFAAQKAKILAAG
jgi:hypothetical protein